jgi:hypothetical protein
MITQNAPRFSLFVKEEERMKDNDRAFLLGSRRDSGTERPDLKNGGMTLSRYASIHLRVPMSGDPDLDRAIRESRRLDLAEVALKGMLASDIPELPWTPEDVACRAFRFADTLLAKWEKEKAE